LKVLVSNISNWSSSETVTATVIVSGKTFNVENATVFRALI